MRGDGAGNWLLHVAIARGGVESGRKDGEGIRTSTAPHGEAQYGVPTVLRTLYRQHLL